MWSDTQKSWFRGQDAEAAFKRLPGSSQMVSPAPVGAQPSALVIHELPAKGNWCLGPIEREQSNGSFSHRLRRHMLWYSETNPSARYKISDHLSVSCIDQNHFPWDYSERQWAFLVKVINALSQFCQLPGLPSPVPTGSPWVSPQILVTAHLSVTQDCVTVSGLLGRDHPWLVIFH